MEGPVGVASQSWGLLSSALAEASGLPLIRMRGFQKTGKTVKNGQ